MRDLPRSADRRHMRFHFPKPTNRAAAYTRMRALLRSGLMASLLLFCVTSPAAGQTEIGDPPATPPVASAEPVRPVTVRRPKIDKPKDTKGHDSGKRVEPSSLPASASVEIGPPPAPDAGVDAGSNAEAVDPAAVGAAPLSSSNANANVAGAPPSVTATIAPSASASTSVAKFDVAEVKIRDTVVLRLKLADGGLIPTERAARAMRAIEAALAEGKPDAVRSELRQDRVLLFIGQRPIVELTREDAEAVGEGSLEMFAASAAAKVRDALETEHQRSIVAHNAFNVALVILLAVLALYALRLIGALARRLRDFVRLNPDRIPAIRLRSIEVIGPHVLRSGIVVGLGVVKLLLQLTLVFAWLLFSSSMFDATRGMTGQLTSLVLAPLSGLAGRFVALLPVLLLTTIGVVVLVVLLRFVSLFFAGVERRETELAWLRPELASPTSLLIRIGLVVVSLLLGAPLLTGNVDGSLARVGMLCVGASALATTPFLANIVVGLATLYGGRLQLGDEVRIGAHVGRLVSVDLVDLRLSTTTGHELRIPHLVTLVHPLAVVRRQTECVRRLVVTAEAPFERLLEVLSTEQKLGSLATVVVLARVEGTTATAELIPKDAGVAAEQCLLVEVVRELESSQIGLVLAEWRPLA